MERHLPSSTTTAAARARLRRRQLRQKKMNSRAKKARNTPPRRRRRDEESNNCNHNAVTPWLVTVHWHRADGQRNASHRWSCHCLQEKLHEQKVAPIAASGPFLTSRRKRTMMSAHDTEARAFNDYNIPPFSELR